MRKIISSKYFLLAIIVLSGAFLRFFKLSEFPVQLNHDEISQIYDVKSIVQTGKDIYGKFLPLAFYSTGDYKPGHYIYISTLPYLFFGNQEITIRIAAAIFGVLTIVAVFLFVYRLTKDRIPAFFSAGLVAISPSAIFYSRKSFESVIGESLIFFGATFLLLSLEKTYSKRWGFLGMLFLGSAMYVYTSYIVVVPLIILLLIIVFWPKMKPRLVLFFLTFFIIPLIILSLAHPEIRFRAASVFVTQDVNLGRLITLGENPAKAFVDHVFTRYLVQFNPIYLLANGLDLTNQGIVGMGPLLLWQLPFLLLGVTFLIKKESFSNAKKMIFGLTLIAMIPSAITFEAHSPHRAMLAFTALNIISAFGVYWLIRLKLNRLILILLSGLLFLNFAYFVRMYTVSYPYEKSQYLQFPFKQVAQFAWQQYDSFKQIIIDSKFGETSPMIGVATHYYLVFYGNYPPDKLQKELKLDSAKGEISFDKFSIRPVFWPSDKNLKNTLIFASSWSLPMDSLDKDKIIKTFYFYDHTPAFYAVAP